MIAASTLLDLRDRGVGRNDAAAELEISFHTFRALCSRYGIKWPRPCRQRHPVHDKVVVDGYQRCRLCWLTRSGRRLAPTT